MIRGQPDNTNSMSQSGFRFMIERLPTVNYFSQAVSIPSVMLGSVDMFNPVSPTPVIGDRLMYEPLSLRFKVDENLDNYLEIYNWMVGLGHPEATSQKAEFTRTQGTPGARLGTVASMVSDATLVILNSHKIASHYVFFRKLHPVSLTELQFDSTASDATYLEATASFKYQRFDIEKIKK